MKERPPGIVLGLLVLCAAACAADGTNPGTLLSMTWLPRTQADTETLKVCPDLNGRAVTMPHTSVFVYTSNRGSSGVDEIINVPSIKCDDICCEFNVDMLTIDFDNLRRYQLNMLETFFTNELKLRVKPEEVTVEEYSDGDNIRYRYQYNGDDWISEVNTCIKLDHLEDVCYSKTGTLCIEGTIKVCNELSTSETVGKVQKLQSVLNPKTGTVKFTQETSDLEILLLPESKSSYCTNAKCHISYIAGASYEFSVVELDNSGNAVAWSKVTVEDWDILLTAVSSDTMRARWTVASPAGHSFSATISPSPSTAPYDTATAQCDEGGHCEAYFAWLEDTEEFTVSVYDGVGATIKGVKETPVDTTLSEDDYALEMTHTSESSKVSTDVVFNKKIPASYAFVMIDSTGNFVEQRLPEDSTTFDTIKLDNQFHIREKVRLLLYDVIDDVAEKVTFWQADRTLFLPVFEPRSNGYVVLAAWVNANDGTVSSNGFNEEQDNPEHAQEVQCAHLRDCEYYLKTDGAQMKEVSGEVTQIVFSPHGKAVAELELNEEFTQRADNRFLVCFTTPTEAVERYELGMEKPGSLSSYAFDAELQEGEDGQSCLLTKDPVAVGSYADVWAVVTGFDKDGKQILGGDQTSKFLLAADGAYVLGVVQYTEGEDSSVWVSWLLVDDTEGLEDYTVELRDENNEIKQSKPVEPPLASHTFTGVSEGRYSACVSIAATVDPKISLEMCSAMIYVESPSGAAEGAPRPPDRTNHQMDPEENSLKFSWEYDQKANWEEVSSFLVDWKPHSIIGRKKRSARSSLPRPKAKEGFLVVPGSRGTVDLKLRAGSYDICVSSNGGKSLSKIPTCSGKIEFVDNIGDDVVPEKPTNLKYAEKMLTWDAPEECDDVSTSCSYSVLWKQGGTEKAHQLDETALDMSKQPITPGSWTAEVRTLVNNIASPRESILVDFTGIDVEYEQSSSDEITLSWKINEGAKERPKNLTYNIFVTGEDGEEEERDTVTCMEDCSVVLIGINNEDVVRIVCSDTSEPVSWNSKVLLADKMDLAPTEVSTDSIPISMEVIERVTLKTKSVTSTAITSVTWNCVDGASRYKLSVTESGGATYDFLQSTPCMYSFANSSRPVEAVEVRAGYEVTGTTCTGHFGDPLIVDTGNGKNNDDGASVLVIVLSVCGSLAVVAVLVLLGFNYMRPSTKKQKPMEDGSESRYGDMAASIHTGDGSHASGFANAGFDMDPYSPNSPRGRDPEQLDPKGLSRHSLGHPGPHRGPRGEFAPEDRYQPPLRTFEPKSLDRAQRDMRQPDPYGPPRRRFDPEDPYRAPRRRPDPQDPPQRSSRPQPRNVDPEFDVERPPRRRPRSSHRDVERGRSPRRHGSSRRDMDDAVSPRRRPHSSHRDMADAVSPRRQYPPGPRDGPREGARDRSRHGPREGQRPSRRDHSAPQTSDIPLTELPRKAYPPPPPRRSDRRNYDEFSKPYNRRSSPKPSAAPPNPNFLMRAKVHGQDEMY